MPSHYDQTYNNEYSKPTYDTDIERIKYQTIREADYILEPSKPRDPTREDELEYMDWLEQEFLHDPWVTYRFRKYMAGPKRWPWKNQREIKRQYQYTFLVNAIIGGLMTWPLAVWVGRRAQKFQGGVPLVPLNKFVHDFVNLEPARQSRLSFRINFTMTMVAGGILFAYLTVDQRQQTNQWYNRPDLKPFPAMVSRDTMDVAERTMLESHYQTYRRLKYQSEKKKSAWYRLFFPLDADYNVKENPWAHNHVDNVYNPNNGFYSTYTNRFRDHYQE